MKNELDNDYEKENEANKESRDIKTYKTDFPKEIEEIKEGKATVKLCNTDKSFKAFYNPAQELNRDLSVLSIATYFTFTKYKREKDILKLPETKFKICEPLSATGLRGMRYFTELPNDKIEEIVANDMDSKAVDCIKQNMIINKVNESQFKVYQKDASQLLYSFPKYFDVLDMDPYGTAIPFIDSCLYSAKNGSLLCVTFTDMPVLCGNYPETTFYKYGAIPFKASFCHEVAKRLALFAISTSASKYKKVIKPLLSFNAEFYIRLFFIVKDSPDDCKKNSFKYGYMYHCRQCQNRFFSQIGYYEEGKIKNGKANSFVKFNNLIHNSTHCNVCDNYMCMTGPYWIDDLHDEDFINALLENLNKESFSYLKYNERLKIILNGIKEELPLKSVIFNYDYSHFSSDIGLSTPKLGLFKGALHSLGYKMAQSYYDPNLFKTDAPAEVIYDILKAYKKENYKEDYIKNIKEGTYKYNILSKEIKVAPVFVDMSKPEKTLKYPMNPTPNWGPKGKAK